MQITSSQYVVWDAVVGAASYEVELLNGAAGAQLGLFSVVAPVVTIPASTLLAGQSFGNYNVRVRAMESAGPGTWSPLLALQFTALPPPGNVRVES